MIDIGKLADRLEPQVRDAFVAAVNRVTGQVRLSELVAALDSGDIEGALQLLRMDRGAFRPYEQAFAAAYGVGGDKAYTALVKQGRARGAQVRGYFSESNLRAQRFVEGRSAALITEINAGTRDAVRSVLSTGMQANTSPRTAALNLVGRVNRATGAREGGLVGLTSGQQRWAAGAAMDLLQGDGTAYFNRTARNRTYDKAIRAALQRDGRVPAALRERAVQGYKNNLLRYRGETIARTELLGGLHAAQDEAMGQMMERENMPATAVTELWDASNDASTRESHRFMDGQPRQRGQLFTSGAGYALAYPGDRSHGAPAEEVINCRCVKRIDVDWTFMLTQAM